MQSSLSEGDEKLPLPNSAWAVMFQWRFLSWGWAALPAWTECFVLWFYSVGSQAWTWLSSGARRAPGPIPCFDFLAVRCLGAPELPKWGISVLLGMEPPTPCVKTTLLIVQGKSWPNSAASSSFQQSELGLPRDWHRALRVWSFISTFVYHLQGFFFN